MVDVDVKFRPYIAILEHTKAQLFLHVKHSQGQNYLEKSEKLNAQLFGKRAEDLFLELAAKIAIENIEHNIFPNNFQSILHFLTSSFPNRK